MGFPSQVEYTGSLLESFPRRSLEAPDEYPRNPRFFSMAASYWVPSTHPHLHYSESSPNTISLSPPSSHLLFLITKHPPCMIIFLSPCLEYGFSFDRRGKDHSENEQILLFNSHMQGICIVILNSLPFWLEKYNLTMGKSVFRNNV